MHAKLIRLRAQIMSRITTVRLEACGPQASIESVEVVEHFGATTDIGPGQLWGRSTG